MVDHSRYLEVLHSSNGRERIVPVTMQEFVRLSRVLPFGIKRGRFEGAQSARSRISSVWRWFLIGIGNVNLSSETV